MSKDYTLIHSLFCFQTEFYLISFRDVKHIEIVKTKKLCLFLLGFKETNNVNLQMIICVCTLKVWNYEILKQTKFNELFFVFTLIKEFLWNSLCLCLFSIHPFFISLNEFVCIKQNKIKSNETKLNVNCFFILMLIIISFCDGKRTETIWFIRRRFFW